MPTIQHSKAVARLIRAFYKVLPDECCQIGDSSCEFRLNGQKLLPDCWVMSNDRYELVTTPYPTVAPELVVEVTSPTDRAKGEADKITTYLDAGVKLIVVINPMTATVTQYRRYGVEINSTLDLEPIFGTAGKVYCEVW